jgi:hypothetical protein
LETLTIDSKTLVIKTDNEDDLPQIIDYISQKDKNNIGSFLNFASKNRLEVKNYKFNRDDMQDGLMTGNMIIQNVFK